MHFLFIIWLKIPGEFTGFCKVKLILCPNCMWVSYAYVHSDPPKASFGARRTCAEPKTECTETGIILSHYI